ncbi:MULTISPECIES: hypothetical protein [unclassified Nostoc]|nr:MULTISPECIES: hypothetical protein [unclassified Nostoc]MDM9580544.1 hypothetical protein [Nostoc sp. GT001]MDZ7945956.1 hypothetical protein [Nostoc sp. EfeVER01]MDZ7990719.1 hypothetical protein [Nostoc sp. EspVER01]
MSRSQSETGNAVLEAPPPLLAAERQEQHFQPRGWKRDLQRLSA